MSTVDGLVGAAVAQASVIGAFGAIGLALTVTYSRRGPLIYPVYAAILAALTLLLARFSTLGYVPRFAAALIGFAVASVGLYLAAGVSARRSRRRLVRQGRIPASGLHVRISLVGHAWRLGSLLSIGALLSAGVAFVSM